MVAFDHLNVGQEMMGQVDRLRPLEVSVPGDYDVLFTLAKLDQSRLKRAQFAKQFGALVAEPQAQIERDLVDVGVGRLRVFCPTERYLPWAESAILCFRTLIFDNSVV
jgi:hypothetical protein